MEDQRLIILAAGDSVYVFGPEQIATADAQHVVLIGANLDVERFRPMPGRWTEIATELDGVEVNDYRTMVS